MLALNFPTFMPVLFRTGQAIATYANVQMKTQEEEIPLPQWLCNQLMRAFHKKDSRQIKLLNECWFFYRNKPSNSSVSRSADSEM